MAVTTSQIEAALRMALDPSSLSVRDDSDDHAGHAGAGDGSHFSVFIEARAFVGLTPVARHRVVYDALSQFMAQGIHALAIHAKVPSV